jgi:type II secretory pathway predicted ATPase ExeA
MAALAVVATGPTSLRDALTLTKTSAAALSREIGIADRTVTRWLSGVARPTGASRAALERWYAAHGLELAVADLTDLDAERARRARKSPPVSPPPTEEPMEITSREYLDPEELTHFRLAADPFEDDLDPEAIYLSPRLLAVERALMGAIHRRQLLALVGNPGSGKSTLLRRLFARAQREKRIRLISPATLNRKCLGHAPLTVAILRDLIGRDTSSMAMEARDVLLRDTLADQVAAGVFPVVLLDEAHLLKNEALLAIKQLWDSHTLFRQLAVLMIGQLPLRDRLVGDPAVREVTGRTRILELGEMKDETADYLRWRFARVQAQPANATADQIFDPGAYKALGLRAENPLWINNSAVRAMRHAFRHGDTTVTAAHIGRS